MTDLRGDRDGRTAAADRPLSATVLADRMAAALLHHEPGWRLPRHTALARRYNVTTAEIDAAIELLAGRHLLSRLPDGQVFRASPAEYRLVLEGLPGLASQVNPMGGELACKSRTVSRRRAAEDVARALGAGPGGDLLTIRCLWTVGGEPAAFSASYLPPPMEGLVRDFTGAAAPTGPPAGQAARARSRWSSRRPRRRWHARCGWRRVSPPPRSPSGSGPSPTRRTAALCRHRAVRGRAPAGPVPHRGGVTGHPPARGRARMVCPVPGHMRPRTGNLDPTCVPL